MRKNPLVCLFKELTYAQKKRVLLTLLGMGLLFLFAAVLVLFLLDLLPNKHDTFLYHDEWIFFLGFSSLSFIIGLGFGCGLLLSNLHDSDCYQSTLLLNKNSSNDIKNSLRTNDYSSSVSINPASGNPMSGNSRMDISGNPYGTRSW